MILQEQYILFPSNSKFHGESRDGNISSLTVSKITEARHGLLTGEAASSAARGGGGEEERAIRRYGVFGTTLKLWVVTQARGTPLGILDASYVPSFGRVLTMLRNFNSICSGSLGFRAVYEKAWNQNPCCILRAINPQLGVTQLFL